MIPQRLTALAILMGLALTSFGTTWRIELTGSDTSPGDGTVLHPYRTIAKGAAVAQPGDTIEVGPGVYNENVQTVRSNVTFNARGAVYSHTFRLTHPYCTITNFVLRYPQNSYGAFVRIDAGAHHSRVVRNFIGPAAVQISSDHYVTNGNVVVSPSANFAAAGFEPGGLVFMGGSSFTNYMYVNHNTAWTIASVGTTNLAFTETLDAETNNAFWAPIHGGSTRDGIEGVSFIISGGVGASDCLIAGNTFSNIFGPAITLNGRFTTVMGNEFTRLNSYYAIRPHAGDNLVCSNYWHDSTNIINYSAPELSNVPHPTGPEWYDYQVGAIHDVPQGGTSGTNTIFYHNWVENFHNQLGQIGESPGYYGFIVVSNVFVGIQAGLSGGRNGLVFDHNTFFRCSFDELSSSRVLTIGGNSPSTPATNQMIAFNVFLDIGTHGNTNQEGPYTIANPFNCTNDWNFMASAETLNYSGYPGTEAHGINGGDPRLLNPWQPRGADGIPFTADDGLRPIASSPLVPVGWGALEPYNPATFAPVPHFRVNPAPGWKDATGTNFDNPAWDNLAPFNRPTKRRPWNTPEALGNIPVTITFDARDSISNTGSTVDWIGIRQFLWDFGDGSPVLPTWKPVTDHTFLSAGTNVVTLTIVNNYGNVASISRSYRILPQTTYPNRIFYVSTAGSDANSGLVGFPFRTIPKAISVVTNGDYVAVLSGNYTDEAPDINRNAALPDNRITFIGYGARTTWVRIRQPDYTWEGFDMNGQGAANGTVFIYQAAHRTKARHNFIHDSPQTVAAFWGNFTGGPSPPSAGSADVEIIGNYTTNVGYVQVSIGNGTNWLVGTNWCVDSWSEGDFWRPRGGGHRALGNYVRNMNNTHGANVTGGHPDFFQLDTLVNPDGTVQPCPMWYKDILIEGNWVEGDPTSATDMQVCQIATGRFYDATCTNVIVRNNVFWKIRGQINNSIDGLKFHYNTFVGTPRANNQMSTGGGINGSAMGAEWIGNILFECGATPSSVSGGWYWNGASGPETTNSTVIADYNFVCGTGGAAKQVAPPDALTRWASLGQEAHGINGGDPLFVDLTHQDLRLASSSPLRDVGVAVSGVSSDLYGVSRPQGASLDLGAFEFYGVGIPPIPPPTPTIRAIIQFSADTVRVGSIQPAP